MNKNINKKTFFIKINFLILFLIILFQSSLAIAYIGFGNIIIETYPKYPGPEDKVELKLKSYSIDINSSDISITVNGKVIKEGIGLKEASFVMGELGEVARVVVSAQTLQGENVVKELKIVPASVDLIYELANPLRPFNYKGKSEAISNSELTIFAFPSIVNEQGQKVSKDSLIYTWYKNYKIDLGKSGFGKSTYKINRLDAYPMETIISVKVTTIDKKITAESFIYLVPESTEVEFYLLDPALPFSYKNIADKNIISKYLESNILAVPYFIDTEDKKIKYTWKVNDKVAKTVDGSYDNKILLLNSFDNFTSELKLSLEIINRSRILQSVDKKIKVLFEKNNQDNGGQFFDRGSSEEWGDGLFKF